MRPDKSHLLSQDGPQSRAALATANRRSALLRFRRKREARTFDKKVGSGGSYRSTSSSGGSHTRNNAAGCPAGRPNGKAIARSERMYVPCP